MEATRFPHYRRPRVLYAFGVGCIVVGALVLYGARIGPSAPNAGATTATVDGITVALHPASAAVGPVTLTIDMRAAGGGPVTGAAVTIRAVSLEMAEMDAAEATAVETEPGRYVTADVPLGMGGAWEVETEIAVSGRDPVTARMKLTVSDAPG